MHAKSLSNVHVKRAAINVVDANFLIYHAPSFADVMEDVIRGAF